MIMDDTIRRDRDALLAELREAGAEIKGKTVKCPFHEDRHPSGNVYMSDDGIARYKCHAASCGFCGDLYDVRAKATGQPIDDVLKAANPSAPRASEVVDKPVYSNIAEVESKAPGEVEGRYMYCNLETGAPELVVLRIREVDGKTFWQLKPVPDGFQFGAPGKPWPIYNRARVRDADEVIVVEGEKCVHALHEIGMVATTSPCGAGKASYADWSPLAAKTVYLWPDNDKGGMAHMRDVVRLLTELDPPPEVRWIDPSGLSLRPKADVADFLADLDGCDIEEKRAAIRDVLADAESAGASREVRDRIEAIASGKRSAVDLPWESVSKLTRALLPGTVTLLCGDPGATKSFMLLEAAAYWHRQGVKLALFELEEDRTYHLHRALAQADENRDLIDDDYVRQFPEKARAAWDRHRSFLDGFGRVIWEAPDKQITLKDLGKWVRDRAATGCRIVAIDPVTAAATSDKQWMDDLDFVMTVKAAAREFGTSVVLVTHPRKGRKSAIGLDELSGGAAYQRLSQTVLWIERHRAPKEVTIVSRHGAYLTTVNRTLHIAKCRNGPGHGLSLGFDFDGQSLRLAEQGVIKVS